MWANINNFKDFSDNNYNLNVIGTNYNILRIIGLNNIIYNDLNDYCLYIYWKASCLYYRYN